MGVGAGILFVADTTGRVLLALRSRNTTFPGTWCVVGGHVEKGETPSEAAVREAEEEVGYSGPIDLYRGFVYTSPTFTYHNFIGFVPTQFRPILNDESLEASWFDPERLPEPLHPGTEELLDWVEQTMEKNGTRKLSRKKKR